MAAAPVTDMHVEVGETIASGPIGPQERAKQLDTMATALAEDVQVKGTMAVAPADDVHDQIRGIIESALATLKEWLEIRLQQQDDLLTCLNNSRISWNSSENAQGLAIDVSAAHAQPASASGHTKFQDPEVNPGIAVNDNTCPVSKAYGVTSQIAGRPQAFMTPSGSPTPNDDAADDLIEVVPLPNSILDSPSRNSILEASSDSQFRKPLAFCPSDAESPNELSTQTGSISDTAKVSKLSYMSDLEEQSRALQRTPSWQEQDWQTKLMDIFDQLDLDDTGSIDRFEITEAFEETGMPEVADISAFQIFKQMDRTDNGTIDRIEWLHIVAEAAKGRDGEMDLLCKFLDRLVDLQRRRGCIYQGKRTRRPKFILRHDSMVRMAWDVLMTTLLFYVSVSVPFTLGFGESKELEILDRISDMFFCFDVLLNFRTSYIDNDESIIVDGKKIACKYLKSWFFLDVVSSVPFDLITGGLLPNLTPARLLKFFKIAKVMKLLRISKMLKFAESDTMEKLEQTLASRGLKTFLRIVKLAAIAFLVAHWLACFGNAVDTSCLDAYFAGDSQEPTALQKYLAGIYWAMTTLSTVGYGDITPKSDQERAYAMIAMVIGGSLYGYVIGSVTSMVTDMDVSAHAFQERMVNVQSWLDGHDEIPHILRRRLRKYFKRAMASKSVMDDHSVIKELSPALRADTAFFLVHEHVRRHPMFYNIPNCALAQLVDVLRKNHAYEEEVIVNLGDPGTAMYILVDGRACYTKGKKWQPAGARPLRRRFQQLAKGDSFGEEIVFGLAEAYAYTITTITECQFHSISEDGFKECFQNMPDLIHQMHASFLRSIGSSPSLAQDSSGKECKTDISFFQPLPPQHQYNGFSAKSYYEDSVPVQ